MKLYLKLAWRNVLRNKRRTLIAGTAIGIGMAALIYTDALIIGMEENMIDSATGSFLGEGQIHHEDFLDTFEIEYTINELEETTRQLANEPIVEHFTPRVMSFAMASSPANVSAVNMVGIDPETEQYLSQIDDALIEGDYFETNNDHDILIGRKLAEILEVQLGDRIVLTTAEAYSDELSQEMFRISGIYFFNVAEMDRGMAFILLPKAQTMLNLQDKVHEIAIKFTENHYGRDRNLFLWDKYSVNGNDAIPWSELLPEIEAVFEMAAWSTLILGVILFAVVTLGIINSLFMSLYERMYEFGVMRAVGTRPLVMARLVVLEACALALISIVLGAILGFAVTYYITITGIDYGGIEFSGVTFRELLYPIMELRQFIIYPMAVFIFTALVSIYPAAFAARIAPAEAMRRSL